MRVGSLFSGIGGLDLGLERAGMQVVWQCEIDPYCRTVLAHHWPGLPLYGDIRDIDDSAERVDLICGGFPCQDISSVNTSGVRAGLAGERSGLWREFRRVVGLLRPRWVVVENSPRWRAWVPEVTSDLGALGYSGTCLELPAGAFGAPHRRKRCFVVANSDGSGEPTRSLNEQTQVLPTLAASHRRDWRKAPSGGFRVDDGVPSGVAQLRAFGNAVVPQVAEFVGRLILEAEGAARAA